MLPELSLADLQKFLYRLIVAPDGVEKGLAAEKEFSPATLSTLIHAGALSATLRVGIYANMYFYRLLDAIKEDFPATFTILGDVNFHNLITEYLIEYPPGHPSLTEVSRNLAKCVEHSQFAVQYPFLADLIRLERALVEVFLGSDTRPLSCDELRAVPVVEWSALRFGLHPAIQLLDSQWRVDETLRAIEQALPFMSPAAASTSILVWRKEWGIEYRALEQTERGALAAVCCGDNFMVACESIQANYREITPARMSEMLLRWVADGIVLRIT
jgi:hypothetical protein